MIIFRLAFLLQESELIKKWGKLAELKKQVLSFWIWNDIIPTSGILPAITNKCQKWANYQLQQW